jgi:hypothetical protein
MICFQASSVERVRSHFKCFSSNWAIENVLIFLLR